MPLVLAGATTVMPWFFYLGSMEPALGAICAAYVLRSDGGVSGTFPSSCSTPISWGMGWATIGWAVALIAGSFWLGRLARLGRWSIVPVVFWHGGFDFLTSSDLGPSTFPATISTLVMVQAAVVIVVLAGRSRSRTFGAA
ncbi:MAG: hypothetical protein ABI065_09090 [Terrimesophilobacter sp.]